MRIFILPIAVLLSFTMSAQTYFYIHTITVDPANPTTSDMVSIQLTGDLSSTGSSITAASAEVVGNTVNISITAVHTIGLDVLVAHTELIELGMLTAGDYEIVVLGTNVDDFAASVEHQFTVSGGSPCDDLVIDFVRWDAFSDTAVIVHVFNNSTELFDYPGFVLLDMDGDTIAKETVNFFGIGIENYHTLTIQPGAIVPFGTSSYALHLWTNFYEEQACTWQLDADLCPPVPCQTLYPDLQNFGGGMTIGDFVWTILNEDLDLVASGVFTLTDTLQNTTDSICLPAGHYSMDCSPQQAPSGGQPNFGVTTSSWLIGPHAPVVWSLPTPMEFDFYPSCFDGANGVHGILPETGLLVQQTTQGLELMNLDGNAIGAVEIFSADGKLLHSTTAAANHIGIALQPSATGLIIVRAGGKVQRYIR